MGGNLNQDEIDALLNGPKLEEEPGEKAPVMVQALRTSTFVTESAPRAAPEPKEPAIREVVYDELSAQMPVQAPVAGMEVLLDVPLNMSVELGRARCFVKDLLNLSAGSVVELDRSAGDVVDILVNGKLFARGEVVVIDENFGVRIQEIVHRPGGDRLAKV